MLFLPPWGDKLCWLLEVLGDSLPFYGYYFLFLVAYFSD